VGRGWTPAIASAGAVARPVGHRATPRPLRPRVGRHLPLRRPSPHPRRLEHPSSSGGQRRSSVPTLACSPGSTQLGQSFF